MKDILYDFCVSDGCLQCEAESGLAVSREDSAAIADRQLDERIAANGSPHRSARELRNAARRAVWRMSRLIFHLALHDPHECGKPAAWPSAWYVSEADAADIYRRGRMQETTRMGGD